MYRYTCFAITAIQVINISIPSKVQSGYLGRVLWRRLALDKWKIRDGILFYVRVKSLQSYPTLGDPMNCNLPGSSVHGILQARILVWVTMPSSRGSSPPRDQTQNSRLLHWWAGSLPLEPRGKPKYVLLLCCPVLSCSVMSDSATIWNVARQTPLSIGILQAKILEWVAMPSSRGSSQPRD